MLRNEYNLRYLNDDYFNNRKWKNEIFVRSLVKKSGLARASRILDVGCGQGYFSYLFSKYGMNVLGVDLSETGIVYARNQYKKDGPQFLVCDVWTGIPVSLEFEGVFVRSLSIYNTENVQQIRDVTQRLMEHVKTGGIFIFCYNANLNKRKQRSGWRSHSLNEVKRYFSEYENKSVYFSSKIDCAIIGKYAFNKAFSIFNVIASKLLGLSGEIVCFIRK